MDLLKLYLELLFGLIEIKNDAGHTGLFNNSNYLGMWLTLCLPFSLSFLKNKDDIITNKLTLIFINILIIYFLSIKLLQEMHYWSNNIFFIYFWNKKIIKFCLFFY